MISDQPAIAEPLVGYSDLGGQSPRPMSLYHLQRVRDAADPKGSPEEVAPHRCERCGPCYEAGLVVSTQDVRALLQHIDYLQRELDEIDDAQIDYFGDDF